MRAPLALLAAAVAFTLAGAAAADVTVPGYVETCSLAKQAKAGQECFDCRAYYGNHDHCSDSLASFGFTQTCRTGGASAWSEVWCRAASPAAKKVPPEILGQLSRADSHVKADPGAPPPATPPAPTAAATGAPAPSSASAATGLPAPGGAPAATGLPAPGSAPQGPPGPPPQPQPQGCGCTVGTEGAAPLFASLLAGVAAAAIALRRRHRQ
jgi:MYXO-CTERM domain-containing protein